MSARRLAPSGPSKESALGEEEEAPSPPFSASPPSAPAPRVKGKSERETRGKMREERAAAPAGSSPAAATA
jgi:hypothetical protein